MHRISMVRGSLALLGLGFAFGGAAGAGAHDTPDVAPSATTPFSGDPFAVPAGFEAVDFDRNGQDAAYHDSTPGNAGGAYRAAEDVDIRATGNEENPFVIFNFETGEWLNYTIDVAREGQYAVGLKVSTTFDDAAFRVEIDGVDASGRVAIPKTGNWQRYSWVDVHVPLPAGRHVLRVVSEHQYFNFDAVRVASEIPETPALETARPITSDTREPDAAPLPKGRLTARNSR